MKELFNYKTLLVHLLLLPVLLSLSGCVYLIVGGVGALGGYIVSPDTVEGITSSDEIKVWDSIIEVVSIMGTIKEQSEEAGVVIAKVGGAKVTITVSIINDVTTKLSVKARKHFLPRINVAQDVFVKIMSNLQE